MSTALSNFFIYCYFGKLATKSFEDMPDLLYESNWQTFPIRLQKYIILMIGNMQRPLYYHGFGMVLLDLGTFSKVRVVESTGSVLQLFARGYKF